MLPTAAELEYFLEVASALNVSKASKRLGISQPSLSLAMQRLEKTIGAPLFIRHQQGVLLTPAGKQLFLHTRQLLQYWNSAKSQALTSQEGVKGQFTLGCHPTIAIYMVSKFLPNLLEQYPELQIHLKNDISRKVAEQVINLSIDIGIIVNPIKHPDLIIRKLCQDEVCFWVGKGKRKIQDIYSKEAIVICDPDLIQTQTLLKNSKKLGIVTDRIMPVHHLEVIASLVANGCGIGILPARVAECLYPNKLHRIPNLPAYSDEICLVYRNENRDIQAIQTIVNVIIKRAC